MYNPDFLKAMDILIQNEGLYSNDPDDNGGETFVGISKKFFPNWKGWKRNIDLSKITRENLKDTEIYKDILDFYYKNFWEPLKLNSLPKEIRIYLFDMAVNMGLKTAIKILQRTIGTKPDGIIGPVTISVANNFDCLFPNLKLNRIKYYVDLTNKNKKYKKFLLGWINRCFNT